MIGQRALYDPSGISSGYCGCATSKAATTEILKLKMKEMTSHHVVKEVAKMICIIHYEVKNKTSELELT